MCYILVNRLQVTIKRQGHQNSNFGVVIDQVYNGNLSDAILIFYIQDFFKDYRNCLIIRRFPKS